MPPTSQQPGNCEIRSWVCFGPGYWRQSLYSPDDCRRIAPNFYRLRGYLGDPVVKLGHDRDQRLQDRLRESLGFLSLGYVSRVQTTQDGKVVIDLSDVPTSVGAQINAGQIRSGSVELIPFAADPRDPSKRIEGPILVGVALLGEEAPAVKGLGKIPRAVFADGTPVPASGDPAKWLEAMAEVHRMSARGFSEHATGKPRTWRAYDGSEYPLHTISFSEMTPMGGLTPEFLQLLGISPEHITEIMAKANGGGGDVPPPPPADPAPPAAPPAAPSIPPIAGGGPDAPPVPPKKPGDMAADDQTMMSSAMQKCMSDAVAKATAPLIQRIGAMEAKNSDATKSAEMSAFSAMVDAVLKENGREGNYRVTPAKRARYRANGLRALTEKCFGEVSNDRDQAFAIWKSEIESLPLLNYKHTEQINDSATNTAPGNNPSPFLQKLAGKGSFLDKHAQTSKKFAS